MCQADFLGKSVSTEEHLCKYVKNVIDDADAEEGYAFNRFMLIVCLWIILLIGMMLYD